MNRSTGLDALRAAACLLVVAFHLRTVGGVGFGPFDALIKGGDTGVYVFFALSGYLLYRPFVDSEVNLGTYAIKRAARILPAYYLSIVALTLLTGSRLAVENPLPYLVIASSYSAPLRDFLGSAWTLSAEVIFYVTLPVIARAAARRELRVIGGLGFASIATTLGLWLTPGLEADIALATYPAVFYTFVPGMLLAVVELRAPGLFTRLGRWPYPVLGVSLIALGASHSLPVAIDSALGAALVIGWLLQHRVPGGRAFAFAGGASYALYLWHKDLIVAFGPFGAVLAIMGSALSWAIIERPILTWAHRISRRRTQPLAEAPAA